MIKIYDGKDIPKEDLSKKEAAFADIVATVSEIIETVKSCKDQALLAYSEKFDHVRLSRLEVSAEEIEKAYQKTDKRLIEVMEEAARNIYAFHKNQVRTGFSVAPRDGVVLGQKIIPFQKVGLYVPGGTASYPSSVLMNCIPAKLAGVEEIIMVTPPSFSGGVNPVILAAAKIAGVGRVFRIGGAQAIAALAFGTETVPRVDKIVGPGNAFVAEAKKQVFGRVSIDMIAGPSDILVIADESCDARVVAADLLSQAEHDKNASAVLVTNSRKLAEAVATELETQIAALPREEIARASIEGNGKIIIAQSIEEAVDIANEIAPEHLEVCVDRPFDYLHRIQNAGSIFLGKNCPEVLGDYFAGPNHVLPTGGTARFSSPLSVDDFIKKSSFTYYSAEALEKISDKVACFAESEGLSAHARSVLVRGKGKNCNE